MSRVTQTTRTERPATTEPRCGIARSLAVLGEKWTLLIVREAMWGRTRFGEFRDQLGVAPDILTDRLTKLVGAGILQRRTYQDEGARERPEYVLTDAGRDLLPVLGALADWGDAHRPIDAGPAVSYADAATGRPVTVSFVDEQGNALPADRVAVIRRSA
jgi:DNA-binding HxlR family transcriptional regulator